MRKLFVISLMVGAVAASYGSPANAAASVMPAAAVAAANAMPAILPICKGKAESAVKDFNRAVAAPEVGFTRTQCGPPEDRQEGGVVRACHLTTREAANNTYLVVLDGNCETVMSVDHQDPRTISQEVEANK